MCIRRVLSFLLIPFTALSCRSPVSPLAKLERGQALSRLAAEGQLLEQLVDGLEDLCDRAREQRLIFRDAGGELVVQRREDLHYFLAAFLDYTRAIDTLRRRYDASGGLDDGLAAEVYLLAYAAELALYVNTAELLQETVDQGHYEAVFDEAMPELGIPAGSWRDLKTAFNLQPWKNPLLLAAAKHAALGDDYRKHGVAARQAWAIEYVDAQLLRMTRLGLEAGPEVLVREWSDLVKAGFHRIWFPAQATASEWLGDTRTVEAHRQLISPAQLEEARALLRPGDLILERRNWYLSNIGLPGFWPHTALYVGTRAEAEAFLGAAAVADLVARHPEAAAAWDKGDAEHRPGRVLEAVSEGVIFNSLEHSCAADYVAVLRPRLAPEAVAAALDRAFAYFGRPYDFDCDFRTDDAVVCSELVYKAYDPGKGPGLHFPLSEVLGRPLLPPTTIAATFVARRGKPEQELDFVLFLEGVEKEKRAHLRDEAAFAATPTRTKWDVAQP